MAGYSNLERPTNSVGFTLRSIITHIASTWLSALAFIVIHVSCQISSLARADWWPSRWIYKSFGLGEANWCSKLVQEYGMGIGFV